MDTYIYIYIYIWYLWKVGGDMRTSRRAPTESNGPHIIIVIVSFLTLFNVDLLIMWSPVHLLFNLESDINWQSPTGIHLINKNIPFGAIGMGWSRQFCISREIDKVHLHQFESCVRSIINIWYEAANLVSYHESSSYTLISIFFSNFYVKCSNRGLIEEIIL